MPDPARLEAQRPRLRALAYRMLGQVADAEDIVQETFLRFSATPAGTIETPPAWLVTVATRLCLDRLRRARRERAAMSAPGCRSR